MDTNPSEQPEKKSNNTVLIIVGAVILLCCCLVVVVAAAYMVLAPAVKDVNEKIEEGIGYNGLADDLLKSDVTKAIADYEQSQTGCTDVTLFGGQVLVNPEQSGDGSWTETWQMMVCGESRVYSIVFTPSPAGGTDFSVTRIDQ
jgi:hypothetical protein